MQRQPENDSAMVGPGAAANAKFPRSGPLGVSEASPFAFAFAFLASHVPGPAGQRRLAPLGEEVRLAQINWIGVGEVADVDGVLADVGSVPLVVDAGALGVGPLLCRLHHLRGGLKRWEVLGMALGGQLLHHRLVNFRCADADAHCYAA